MSLIPCNECGKEISSSAPICPHCGIKRSQSGNGKVLVVGFVVILAIAIIAAITQTTTTTTTTNTAAPTIARAPDAADSLIAECGKPSLDDSTAHDDPRPPMPSRIIEYKAKKLRFLFIPGDGAKMGDAPPYRWELMGITDMTARDPSKAKTVSPEEAVVRMPCWTEK